MVSVSTSLQKKLIFLGFTCLNYLSGSLNMLYTSRPRSTPCYIEFLEGKSLDLVKLVQPLSQQWSVLSRPREAFSMDLFLHFLQKLNKFSFITPSEGFS